MKNKLWMDSINISFLYLVLIMFLIYCTQLFYRLIIQPIFFYLIYPYYYFMLSNQNKKNIDLNNRLQKNQNYEQSNCNTVSQNSKIVTPSSSIDIIKKLKGQRMMHSVINKVKSINSVQSHKYLGVKEEWEKEQSHTSYKKVKYSQFLFRNTNKIYSFFYFVFLIINIIMGWYVSILLAYQIEQQALVMNIIWFISIITEILVILNTVRIVENRQIHARYQIFMYYIKKEAYIDIICVIGIILISIRLQYVIQISIFLITLVFLIFKINNQIAILKPFIYESSFKKHFALISLFLYLLIAGHTFGLTMYYASNFDRTNNWLIHIGIQHRSWITKYIYSIYWAFTTMVTVGYGDITPQNEGQVIIVIFIEIFGTAMFGYMINIIGMAMTELKKQKANLEQELEIATKIGKCFQLKDDIVFRLKQFIKNNQKVYSTFSVLEEKKIFDKINPSLKSQIIQETNAKVIEKCLYLLTYFSKNFQDKIAIKLIKKILLPNQLFQVSNSNQISLYLIERGNFDILFKKQSKNKLLLKKGKSITQCKDGLFCNIYGYSEVVLGKKLSMNALSKTFTVLYQLKYKDFIDAIQNSPLDFQTFHELKEKYLQNPNLQSIQNTLLMDYREHYIPNSYLIIKKNSYSKTAKRKYMKRKNNINKDAKLNFMKQLEISVPRLSQLCIQLNHINQSQKNIEKSNSISLQNFVESQISIKIQQNKIKKNDIQTEGNKIQSFETLYDFGFQSLKGYASFFNKNNIQSVLSKYKKFSNKNIIQK